VATEMCRQQEGVADGKGVGLLVAEGFADEKDRVCRWQRGGAGGRRVLPTAERGLPTAPGVYAGGRAVFAGGNMEGGDGEGRVACRLVALGCPPLPPCCPPVAPVAPPFALDASASLDTDIS
jgi:hypothetical protein